MARTNTQGFFYLKCINCGMFRRDVKTDLEYSHTKSLMAKFNVKSIDELKAVYLCRKCRKPQKEVKQEPKVKVEGRVNTPIVAKESQISYLIPQSEGNYISRKIGNKTDVVILTEAFNHNVKNFDNPNGKLKNIMIEGATGVGKTMMCRHLAYKLKLPYKRLNLNGATTTEDLVGQIIPTADKGFQWVDGWVTKFMRFGGVLVLDEINMAQADILALLNSVLDDERTLTLTQKDGEVIKAHKHFFVISTLNANYEGTKPLNEALKDRFSDVLIFGYERKIEEKLVSDKKILDFADKLRFAFDSGEIITPISTRSLIFFENNVRLYGESVAKELFFNRFEKAERKVVVELWNTIYGKKEEATNDV